MTANLSVFRLDASRVGDGINDTIAMKKSLVPVSLRGATTAAIDTAQVEDLGQFTTTHGTF